MWFRSQSRTGGHVEDRAIVDGSTLTRQCRCRSRASAKSIPHPRDWMGNRATRSRWQIVTCVLWIIPHFGTCRNLFFPWSEGGFCTGREPYDLNGTWTKLLELEILGGPTKLTQEQITMRQKTDKVKDDKSTMYVHTLHASPLEKCSLINQKSDGCIDC
jgi:hypothetical protein